MAGYSGTPLVKKLGIKTGHRVALVDAPEGFAAVLGELPAGVLLQNDNEGKTPFDVVLFFVPTLKELRRGFVAWQSA